MNLSEIKSIITRNPAWVSSIITAAASLFIPFIIVGIGFLFGKLLGFSNQALESSMYGDFLAYLLTGIIVAIMCYFICKAHPKSVWYTPIICNAITLWAGLGNYFIEGNSFFMFMLPFGMGWIFSIIASVWGANISKHNIANDTMH